MKILDKKITDFIQLTVAKRQPVKNYTTTEAGANKYEHVKPIYNFKIVTGDILNPSFLHQTLLLLI